MNIFEKWIRRIVAEKEAEKPKEKLNVRTSAGVLSGEYPNPRYRSQKLLADPEIEQEIRDLHKNLEIEKAQDISFKEIEDEKQMRFIKKIIREEFVGLVEQRDIYRHRAERAEKKDREALATSMLDEAKDRLTVWLHKGTDGKIWAELPSKPGCFASGEDPKELAEALKEAITMWDTD